jgi:phage shock protein A
MLFDWWRNRRKKAPEPVDPLAAFDQLIEDLERQGAEVRKSAATLLALKGDLTRSEQRYLQRLEEIARRHDTAERQGEAKILAALTRDRSQTEALLRSTREALARAESDSRLLLEAAADLGNRTAELRAERESASARLAVGGLVTQGLREQVARFDKALALEAARDEIERAHALADIYREERGAAPSDSSEG